MSRTSGKITIVGCGAIGTTVAYSLFMRRPGLDVVLRDRDARKAWAKAFDISHCNPCAGVGAMRAGGDDDSAGSDVVVLTAGVLPKEDGKRSDVLRDNIEIYRTFIPPLAKRSPDAVFVVVTNPVDSMAYAAYRFAGEPSSRVIGSGTVLDGTRLRTFIGQAFDLDPAKLALDMVGEHGDTMVPLWSEAAYMGTPLAEYLAARGTDLGAAKEALVLSIILMIAASIAKCGRKLYPEKRIKSYLWSSDMKISPFVLATSVCSILLFGCPNPSSSPTAPTETVTLGTQNGTVTSGTAGSVTFAVTTANIVAGTSGTVSWFTSTAGTTAGSVPTGLTPSVSSVAGDAATITMTASASAMAGQYYFKVVFGSGTSPLATLTIAAIPENLYVVNNGKVGANGSISAFTIGTDGSLTAIASSPFATGTSPMVVAASPNGKYLYATNMGSRGPNGISAYSIGPGGSLTAITSGTFSTGSSPYGIVISPNGSCLYVANMGSFTGNNGISAYTIGTDGSLAAIGSFNTSGMPEGIAISPNGNYLYVTNNPGSNTVNSGISAYTIGTGGSLTTIASSPFVTGLGSQSQWIVISPNGNYLYATNYGNISGVNGISAFTIGTDGSLTAITSGTFDTGNTPAGIAISPNGNYLYVTNYGSTGATGISAYSIGAGGALTAITSGTFATGSAPASVAVSADGNYLYVANMGSTGANGISAYSIGTGGALTAITSGTFATGPSPATIAIVQ